MSLRHRRSSEDTGEFLWLISLSDLMILLFLLFVTLYSFSFKKLKEADLKTIVATLKNEPLPPNPIDTATKELKKWTKTQNLGDLIEIKSNDTSVELLVRDKILFPSGQFHLHPSGKEALKKLKTVLESLPSTLHLAVEGHTDNIPIHSDLIEDNWELSAKRSLSVLRALDLSSEMLKRSSAVAYGDTRPLLPIKRMGVPEGISNSDLEQSKNRRVVFRIY